MKLRKCDRCDRVEKTFGRESNMAELRLRSFESAGDFQMDLCKDCLEKLYDLLKIDQNKLYTENFRMSFFPMREFDVERVRKQETNKAEVTEL